MEYHVYWSLKSSCFEFFGDEKYGIFSGKKLMEIWYLLITEKFLFWPFRWWEIRSFLSQKVDGKIIFTGYWEVLVLHFSVMGNTVFFWVKKLMERWYLLVTEKLLFWTFWWWEMWSFFSQKIDEKMIFTSYFKSQGLGNTVFRAVHSRIHPIFII